MIGRSISIAILLFAAYQIFLWVVQPIGNHTLRGGQNMILSDGNIIRAERYLYRTRDFPIVLVGSSLTQVLETSISDPRIVSLAMPGMGPYDGLAVIEKARSHPALILIEINMLQRGASQDLLAEIFSSELTWLRKNCNAARQEFQPASLFVPRLEAALRGGWVEEPERLIAHPLPADHQHQPGPGPGRRERLEIDVEVAISRLPDLRDLISDLGSPVAFYQMPETPEITRSAALKKLREEIEVLFHEPVYLFPDSDYCTSDGEHLIGDDALSCSYYLTRYALERCQTKSGAPVVAPSE